MDGFVYFYSLESPHLRTYRHLPYYCYVLSTIGDGRQMLEHIAKDVFSRVHGHLDLSDALPLLFLRTALKDPKELVIRKIGSVPVDDADEPMSSVLVGEEICGTDGLPLIGEGTHIWLHVLSQGNRLEVDNSEGFLKALHDLARRRS